MRTLLLYILFFAFAASIPSLARAQVIVNEVSQGPSGAQEYVELLALPDPTCPTACVDLRGWIIDDNNGTFATGSGQGIAQGVMRFANDPFWECVNPGTLILIYNEGDVNPDIPTSAPNDCVILLPGDSPYLERNEDEPSTTGTSSYSGLPWGATAVWTSVGMRNGDDSFQTIDPNDLTQPHHAVSWGGNSNNNIIYFSGSAGGKVFFMAHGTNDNPYTQTNWAQGDANTDQTPGAPNNAANAAWINSINNSCMPVPSFANAGSDVEYCPGETTTTTLTASGGVSYEWSTGDMAASTTVSPSSTTSYIVTVTNASSCTETDTVRVVLLPAPASPAITNLSTACDDTATLEATAGYSNYQWSNGGMAASTTVSSTGTYTVTVTDSNTCESSNSISISSIGGGGTIQFLR